MMLLKSRSNDIVATLRLLAAANCSPAHRVPQARLPGWYVFRHRFLATLSLALVLSVSACAPPTSPEVVQATVTLYFSDGQAQHVIPEQRTVDLGGMSQPEAVIRALLSGAEDPFLLRPLPEATALNSIEVRDGIATVDLSKAVRVQGSAAESIAVRAIVYTLTELAEVDRVQILIDGRSDASIGGHALLESPLDRGGILTWPILLDHDRIAWLQQEVDAGRQAWRRDPLAVARFDGRMAGFLGTESMENITAGGDATVRYRTEYGGQGYQLSLEQPARTGVDGIWVLVAVDAVDP